MSVDDLCLLRPNHPCIDYASDLDKYGVDCMRCGPDYNGGCEMYLSINSIKDIMEKYFRERDPAITKRYMWSVRADLIRRERAEQ